MSKRIIFCADGTWDSAQNDTNVAEGSQNPEKQPTLVAGMKPNGKSKFNLQPWANKSFFQ